jgi:hypothetical protein
MSFVGQFITSPGYNVEMAVVKIRAESTTSLFFVIPCSSGWHEWNHRSSEGSGYLWFYIKVSVFVGFKHQKFSCRPLKLSFATSALKSFLKIFQSSPHASSIELVSVEKWVANREGSSAASHLKLLIISCDLSK